MNLASLLPGWRPYRGLVVAILRTSLRNLPASFGFSVVLVLMLVGVRFLQSASFQPTDLALAVQSQAPAAQALSQELQRTPGLRVQRVAAAEARRRFRSEQVQVAVIVPPGFGATDAGGRLRPASAEVDYRSGAGEQALALVAAAVDRADRDAQQARQVLGVAARPSNASLGLVDLFLPGLIAFNVIQSGLILATATFAGYRSSGALRRLQATGIQPSSLVLAQATASLLLGLIQVGAMLAVGLVLFTFHIDLPALFAITVLGYLVFLAAGAAVGGWVRDPRRAPVVATSIGMPMIFIGLFPPSIFSGAAAVLVGVLPVSLVTDAIRRVVEGGGLATVGLDLAGLVAWAAVLLLAAGRAFRWDPA